MPSIEPTIDPSDESPDSFAENTLVTAELVTPPVVTAELVPRWKRTLASVRRWGVLLVLALLTFGFLSSGLSPDPSAIFDESDRDLHPVAQGDRQAETQARWMGAGSAEIDLASVEPVRLEASGRASVSGSTSQTADSEQVLISTILEEQWRSGLESRGLEAGPMADWLTVCRRLSLSLAGTGLSLEEIRSLQRLPEADRVATHRERLLLSDRFHHYWAERTARYLVGADEGPFIVYRGRRFRTWLANHYAMNTPYDELVRMLITAEGVWTDRPEVNFHTVTFDSGDDAPDPIRLAARTTRAFLGVRIDCLQCHDDFLGNVSLGDAAWVRPHTAAEAPVTETDASETESSWLLREGAQEDFHSLAAFFTAATSEGVQGLKDKRADYEYQYLYADETVPVEPNVPFRRDLLPPRPPQKSESDEQVDDEKDGTGEQDAAQQDLDSEPQVDDAIVGVEDAVTTGSGGESETSDLPRYMSDRERLAYWLTHPENKPAARAAVTRVWTLLFGRPPAIETEYGFQVGEVDNLPLDSPPSEMIDTLTEAFVDGGFDVRELIRLITNAPAFRVSSRADFDVTEQHELAMAVFPVTRLRSEQVAGATIQSGRVKTINRDSSFLVQLQQFGSLNDFLKRYGDLGEDEFTPQPVTITQRLVMLNGKLVSETASPNPILNASSHIEMFARNDQEVVRTLYLTVLNREPTEPELKHFTTRLTPESRNQSEPPTSRKQEITDLTWALLNSSEFAWNH
ncbi:hypothetical protein RISK_003557 [Rhodopirellula islandica]|uniref:Uncharacterized protein n=1 Tax=Rhodopirellula islandica TaxID=595434 RepID=A0A0J1BD35_RHOIS|nr:DUF1553 domain-containing protein [Rhodopirellula islandica]KLU04503.1 hypothetical protein RISK_003557 [Rhodopirellula islandica]